MKSTVVVRFKPGVLDPAGRAILQLLEQQGYSQIKDVRVGKVIEFELDETSPEAATQVLSDIADKVLANPIIETFEIEAG